MSIPAPAKQRMSSDQRRAAIVSAAVKLFSQNGFRGTTTRQLAAAVGVSEPVLYMHFQTKRDLYSAIIEHLAKRDDHPFELNNPDMDEETFFRTLAQEILDWHLEDPSRPRILYYSGLEGHELSELFYQQQILPFEQALAAYIQSRIERGRFRDTDPLLAARSFCWMAAHYGLALTVFGHKDDESTRARTIQAIAGIFLKGIQSPGALSK